MSATFTWPSSDEVARMRALAERRMSREEFVSYIEAPMSAEELDGNLELLAWFKGRYLTVLARLQHARRAFANAKARVPPTP